jgi:hypothetical protein
MAKKGTARVKRTDGFLEDRIPGGYENPGPQTREEARRLSEIISQLKRREKTGWVENWSAPWLAGTNLPPFDYFFFEDRLAVDAFGMDLAEIDYINGPLTPQEQEEVARKQSLCSEHGVAYLALNPEDNPDRLQIAAKLGLTTLKKP